MLEIKVWGDWEYAFDAYNAIARLSDSASLMTAAAVIFVLGLFWSVFKSLADDKPGLPFKEMMIAMILWIFFGSSIGAKEDIAILSHQDPSVFATVNDVPILIAWQGWIATNVLGTLREELNNEFTPVSYVSGNGTTDPLEAIVNLYNTPVPPEFLLNPPSAPSGTTGGWDLKRTVNEYIKSCYIADHELSGAEPASPISALRKRSLNANFFDGLRVDYNGLTTRTWLDVNGSEFGDAKDCPTAFVEIKDALSNSNIRNQVQDFYQKKGISNAQITDAIATIEGSFGTGPSSSDIQLGLFQAYMVRDGLRNTSFETDIDMMVFQGARKRMFEAAGESELFTRFSKPLITLLETFAIFLYPVYVILITLGSMGLKHLGKYFTLVIFINLWGIVKTFTDFYVIKSTESAFEAYSNPFSFDGLPQTIAEVEAQLTVAAAAQTAIPAFCMFLVFGGIHALQGAMRQLATANVDGSHGAPSMYSSSNNGSREGNTMTMQLSSENGSWVNGRINPTDASQGALAISGSLSSATSGATQALTSRSSALSDQLNDSVASAIKANRADSFGDKSSIEDMTQEQAVLSTVHSLAEQLQTSRGGSVSDNYDIAYSLVAGGLVGKGIVKGGADYKEAVGEKYKEDISEISQAVKGFNAQLSESNALSETYKKATEGGETLQDAAENSTSDLYTMSRQIQRIDQVSENIGDTASSLRSVARNFQLSQAELAQGADIDAAGFLKQLASGKTATADRLVESGAVETREDALTEIKESLVRAYNNFQGSDSEKIAVSDIDAALESNSREIFEQIEKSFRYDGSSLNNYEGTEYGGLMGLREALDGTVEGENPGQDTASDALIGSDILTEIGDRYAEKTNEDNYNVEALRQMAAAYKDVGTRLGQLGSVSDRESSIDRDEMEVRKDADTLTETTEAAIEDIGAEVAQNDPRNAVNQALGSASNRITLDNLNQIGGNINEQVQKTKDEVKSRGNDIQDSQKLDYVRGGMEAIRGILEDQDSAVDVDKFNPITAATVGKVTADNSGNYGVVYGSTTLMGTANGSFGNLQPEELMHMKAATEYIKNSGILEEVAERDGGAEDVARFELKSDLLDDAIYNLTANSDDATPGALREAVKYLASEVASGEMSASTAESILQIGSDNRDWELSNTIEDGLSREGDEGLGAFFFMGKVEGALDFLQGKDTNTQANVSRQEADAARYVAEQYLKSDDKNHPLTAFLQDSSTFNGSWLSPDRSKLEGDGFLNGEFTDRRGEAALASLEARDRGMLYQNKTESLDTKGRDLNGTERAEAISDAVYFTGSRQGAEVDYLFSKESSDTKTGGDTEFAFDTVANFLDLGIGSNRSDIIDGLGYGNAVINDTISEGKYSQSNNNGGAAESIARGLRVAQERGLVSLSGNQSEETPTNAKPETTTTQPTEANGKPTSVTSSDQQTPDATPQVGNSAVGGELRDGESTKDTATKQPVTVDSQPPATQSNSSTIEKEPNQAPQAPVAGGQSRPESNQSGEAASNELREAESDNALNAESPTSQAGTPNASTENAIQTEGNHTAPAPVADKPESSHGEGNASNAPVDGIRETNPDSPLDVKKPTSQAGTSNASTENAIQTEGNRTAPTPVPDKPESNQGEGNASNAADDGMRETSPDSALVADSPTSQASTSNASTDTVMETEGNRTASAPVAGGQNKPESNQSGGNASNEMREAEPDNALDVESPTSQADTPDASTDTAVTAEDNQTNVSPVAVEQYKGVEQPENSQPVGEESVTKEQSTLNGNHDQTLKPSNSGIEQEMPGQTSVGDKSTDRANTSSQSLASVRQTIAPDAGDKSSAVQTRSTSAAEHGSKDMDETHSSIETPDGNVSNGIQREVRNTNDADSPVADTLTTDSVGNSVVGNKGPSLANTPVEGLPNEREKLDSTSEVRGEGAKASVGLNATPTSDEVMISNDIEAGEGLTSDSLQNGPEMSSDVDMREGLPQFSRLPERAQTSDIQITPKTNPDFNESNSRLSADLGNPTKSEVSGKDVEPIGGRKTVETDGREGKLDPEAEPKASNTETQKDGDTRQSPTSSLEEHEPENKETLQVDSHEDFTGKRESTVNMDEQEDSRQTVEPINPDELEEQSELLSSKSSTIENNSANEAPMSAPESINERPVPNTQENGNAEAEAQQVNPDGEDANKAPDASVFKANTHAKTPKSDIDESTRQELEELNGLAVDISRGLFNPTMSDTPLDDRPEYFESDSGDGYEAVGYVMGSDGMKESEIYQNTSTGETYQFSGYKFKPYDDIGDMVRYEKRKEMS